MAHWLVKSEPDVYSFAQLRKDKVTAWDGVRNHEARNNLRAMRVGDLAFFYHSNADPPGIAGIVRVAKEAYPDPTAFDPRSEYHDPRSTPEKPVWYAVDVAYERAFPRLLARDELAARRELKGMALFKRARLSVTPVSPKEWAAVCALAEG